MKNMSAWAIRNPILPIVLFIVLTFVGIVSFIRLPINLNPDVSFPMVNVTVSQPGAAPTEIETQVTQKIEAAVAGVADVRNITSRAVEGASLTAIEFLIGTPIDRAVNDVRDAVSQVRSELPESIEEPQVQRIDMEGGAIAYYAVSSTNMTLEQLSWFVDNTIAKRLNSIAGVAQASRNGGADREIRIELDPTRLQALGTTAVEVNQLVRSLNLDVPGGRAQVAGGEQSIRVLGGAKTALELGNRQVRLANGTIVTLRDLGEVYDGIAEVRSLSRLNGRPATTFGVFRSRGSSDVTVFDAVQKELAEIRDERPDVNIELVFTTVDNTKRAYKSALTALIEGAALAVLVVFLFLRDGRATFIAALAIPLSAIPTFFVMQSLGFTLNGISLLGLSLVAGVLVDDAIVEIENIVRHMRMGKSGYEAAMEAADEIGLAVVATSATIIAVFLPVSFMGGIVGQYFQQFGLTVASAVFFSLLVARLITPVLAAFMLRPHDDLRSAEGPLMERYMRLLKLSLAHRWLTVAGATLFFAFSVALLVAIPKSFVPPSDFSSASISIELPPGVRLEDTAAVSRKVVEIVKQQPEVTAIVESIGGGDGGMGAADVRSGQIYVTLVRPEQRDVSQDEWEKRVTPLLREVPDARVSFQSMGPGGGRPVALYITGEDPKLAEATAVRVIEQMKTLPELDDPRINGDYKRPEIQVTPRQELAAELGVSVAAISQTIRIATMGDIAANAPKFSLADRQIPIRVSLRESARESLSTIENLPVPTARGGSVPLKAVAEISYGHGPATVRRYNQNRRFYIDAGLKEGVVLGDAMKKVDALPVFKELPSGVRRIAVGEAEFMGELFTSFFLAMGAGILMVFAVMVLLFQRVFQPITILSALPLSIGGAVLALMAIGEPFSLPVVIGFLMLMGIVGKNSILLVDFAIESIRAGTDRATALIDAGHKRARPIIMTTVAMVAGMLPIALGLGGDKSFNRPMAIAVIGGLITSTALTLVVVPAAFTIIDDIERWIGPKFARLLNKEHHDDRARDQA
ncbi:MAG TPA: efflux RND transporter permease subunit, partial [Steroidobacteraceae bacterium]|nr:efflux RND transporter permease subunit [Steroidobacteraceae bacterium]